MGVVQTLNYLSACIDRGALSGMWGSCVCRNEHQHKIYSGRNVVDKTRSYGEVPQCISINPSVPVWRLCGSHNITSD